MWLSGTWRVSDTPTTCIGASSRRPRSWRRPLPSAQTTPARRPRPTLSSTPVIRSRAIQPAAKRKTDETTARYFNVPKTAETYHFSRFLPSFLTIILVTCCMSPPSDSLAMQPNGAKSTCSSEVAVRISATTNACTAGFKSVQIYPIMTKRVSDVPWAFFFSIYGHKNYFELLCMSTNAATSQPLATSQLVIDQSSPTLFSLLKGSLTLRPAFKLICKMTTRIMTICISTWFWLQASIQLKKKWKPLKYLEANLRY